MAANINKKIRQLTAGKDHETLLYMKVKLSKKLSRRRRKEIRAAFNKKRIALSIARLFSDTLIEEMRKPSLVRELFDTRPKTIAVADLSEDQINLIKSSKSDPDHNHLNDLLDEE